MNSKTIAWLMVVVCLCFVHSSRVHAEGVSLYITPATGVYPIGEPITAEIRVSTGGTQVGTVDVSIAFEASDLEYVAVSDEGSILSTILVDSDRKPGQLDLSGFIDRSKPAFTGEDGLVATVTFMPLRNVATQLRFAQAAATPPLSLSASVAQLANVLTDLGAATYTLVPKQNLAPAAVAYASENRAFSITPIPQPSGDWFGSSTFKLSWDLPAGVTEMRTIISKDQNEIPSKVYQIPVSSVELTDVPEGKSFFLMQFKDAAGWGEVIRYPLKVDTQAPSYLIVKEVTRDDVSDPRVLFEVDASDEGSGVEYYEVGLSGDTPERWDRPDNGRYDPKGLSPGEHVLTVVAYDAVRNSTSTDKVFLVKSIEPPVLTDAPDRVLTGDTITVRGTSYPEAEVTVHVSYNGGEATKKTVTSDAAGGFVVDVTDGAREGKYTVWFSVVDARGAMSPPSIKRSVEVSQPYIMLFGGIAVTYLSIIVPLLGLIVLLGLVLWLGYSFVRSYRKKVRQETGEAFSVVNKEFGALRNDLIKQIGMLERANQSRELTREEMRIFRDLSKRLDHIESHIEQEIDDIETVDHTSEEVQSASKGRPLAEVRSQAQTKHVPIQGSGAQYSQSVAEVAMGGARHSVTIQPRR